MSHAIRLIHTSEIGHTLTRESICRLSEIRISVGILYFIQQPKCQYIPVSSHAHSSVLVLDALISCRTHQISLCPSRLSSASSLHEDCPDQAFLICTYYLHHSFGSIYSMPCVLYNSHSPSKC